MHWLITTSFLLISSQFYPGLLFAARATCVSALSGSSVLPERPVEAYHELVWERSLAIIEHQNRLRAEVGLPIFIANDYAKNLRKKPPKKITPDKRYIIVNAQLVLVGFDESLVYPKLKVDDVHSLNHVYQFEGPRLIRAIPATEYYISQMNDVVMLTRGLSLSELRLWRAGDLSALKEHPKAVAWGYNEPRTHLSTAFFHPVSTPAIMFSIPKQVLLEWAQKNLITIGCEEYRNGKPYGIEIVVKGEAWDELLQYLQ